MALDQYSDEELAAIAGGGDLSQYSDDELEAIAGGTQPTQPQAASPEASVPEWGRKHPNLYGLAGAGLSILPDAAALGISTIASPYIGIPAAGAVNAATQKAKTRFLGDPQTNTLKDFALGAGVEVGGRGLGWLAKKGIGLFTPKGVTSEAKDLAADFATRTGKEMNPADITRGKGLAFTERYFKTGPISTGIMESQDRALMGGYTDKIVDPLLTKYGGKQNLLAAGEKGLSAIEANSQAKRAKGQTLYKAIEDLIPGDAMIPDGNLRKTAKMLYDKMARVKPSLQDGQTMQILKDLSDGNIEKTAKSITLYDQFGNPMEIGPTPRKGYDWKTWDALRSRLGELSAGHDPALRGGTHIAGQGDKSGGIYKLLQKAHALDTDSFANSSKGDIGEAIKTARAFWKNDVKQIFDSRLLRRIAQSDPEKIVDMAFAPNGATNILRTRKAVGDKTFDELKGAWLNKIIKTVEDVPGNETVQPASLYNALKKYDQSTLKAIFNKPGEYAEVMKIAKQGNMLRGSERIAGNPSGTAGNLLFASALNKLGAGLVGGALGGATTGDVKGATGGAVIGFIAPGALTKLYLSPKGRRLLTEGAKITKGTQRAAAWATRVAALAGADAFKSDNGMTSLESNMLTGNDPLGIR